MGYSPWGHNELDTIEQLSMHTHGIVYLYIGKKKKKDVLVGLTLGIL